MKMKGSFPESKRSNVWLHTHIRFWNKNTFTGFSGLKRSLNVGASGQHVPGALPFTMPWLRKKLFCPVSWSSRVSFGLLLTLPASVEKLRKSLGHKCNPCVTGNVFQAPSKACSCFSLTQNLGRIRVLHILVANIQNEQFFLTAAQVKLAWFLAFCCFASLSRWLFC